MSELLILEDWWGWLNPIPINCHNTYKLPACFCTLRDCRPLDPEWKQHTFCCIRNQISSSKIKFSVVVICHRPPCIIILDPNPSVCFLITIFKMSAEHHFQSICSRPASTFLCPRLRPSSNSEQSRSTATGRTENFDRISFLANWQIISWICWIVRVTLQCQNCKIAMIKTQCIMFWSFKTTATELL